MQCPLTPKIWQHYQDTGDAQVAKHLTSCASCRAEAGRLAHLHTALAALPVQEVTGEVAARMQVLADIVQGHALTCTEIQDILDYWLAGELDPAQSFLVEDHLLGCKPCAAEVEKAEALMIALRALPQLAAPSAIAERIELARIPWWKKLLPAPAPSWTRQVGWATGLAAILMLAIASMQMAPQVADEPQPKPTRIQEATLVDEPPAPNRSVHATTPKTMPKVPESLTGTIQVPQQPVRNPDKQAVTVNKNNGQRERERKIDENTQEETAVTQPPVRISPADPPVIATADPKYSAHDDMINAAALSAINADADKVPDYGT